MFRYVLILANYKGIMVIELLCIVWDLGVMVQDLGWLWSELEDHGPVP